MTPEARARLRAMVDREIESPSDPERFRREVEAIFPDFEPLMRLWAIKDEDHRSGFYVKSEHVWYRRFGFRMMRPLFLLALAGAVAVVVANAYTDIGLYVDPTLAFACFLAGAFGFYAILQIFAHRWSRRDLHKLDELRHRYRLRLERLLEDIDEAGRE